APAAGHDADLRNFGGHSMTMFTAGSQHDVNVDDAAERVTAVVVNWNTVDLLDACLKSLRDYAGTAALDVIVVDNASNDGSREMLAAQWPDAVVIANDDNRGFAAASNQGIKIATGDYILLINTDAFLTPDCLDKMIASMQPGARVGIVGPRLVYGDGRFQRW